MMGGEVGRGCKEGKEQICIPFPIIKYSENFKSFKTYRFITSKELESNVVVYSLE